jgi:Zn-dependent peptidase ImmA (M78 family)
MIANHKLNDISNASDLTTSLTEQFGFSLEIPVDVDAIAALLGIVIKYGIFSPEDETVGSIAFLDEHPVITINPYKNSYSPRRRFTIAHEIGHYCLHSNSGKSEFVDSLKSMSRTESYWDKHESEANAFAAQLLMPREWVVHLGSKVVESLNPSEPLIESFIRKMAEIFDVSHKSMEYRLKNLNIIK